MTTKLTTGVGASFGPNKLGATAWYDSSSPTVYEDSAVQFTASDKAILKILNSDQTGLNIGTNDYSISFWMKADSLGSNVVLLDKLGAVNGYNISMAGTGGIKATHGVTARVEAQSADGALTTGAWINITVVANRSGNLYIYKNGNTASPIATADISGQSGSVSNSVSFQMGGYGGSTTYGYNGALDSFGIWNKALSASEITALYNSGNGQMYSDLSATEQTGLVSWWGFQEEGGVRYDAKGTNHLSQAFNNIIDNTSTLGTEAVTNGGFDSNTAGWTAGNSATLASVAGGQSGNALQVTNVGANYGAAYQSFTTTAGQNYTLSYYHKSGTTNGVVYVGTAALSPNIYFTSGLVDAAWTLRTVNFQATTTTTYISFFNSTNTDAQTTLFDTISVKPLTQTNLNGGFESLGTGETLGSEKATNGTFDSDTGWTHGADVVIAAGVATMTASGLGALSQAASISTTPTRYKISLAITAITGTLQFRFGGIAGTVDTQFTTTGTKTFYMTSAAAADGTIILEAPSGTVTAVIDNVSVKQVTASNTFLNWTSAIGGSSTINADTSAPNAGIYDFRTDVDSSGNYPYLYQLVCIAGHKYKGTAYAKSSSGTPSFLIGGATGYTVFALTTSYVNYATYFTTPTTGFYIQAFTGSASKSIYLDDITLICTEIPSAAGIASGLAIDGNLCSSFNGTTQYHYVNDNASIRCGDGTTDFEIDGWFNINGFTAINGVAGVFSKASGGLAANVEYQLYFQTSNALAYFEVSDGSNKISVASPTVLVPNTWYFYRCWINSSDHTINISLNNETTHSASIVGKTLNQVATALEFARAVKNNSDLMSGREDATLIIKRLLTPAEITALYNNGKGVKYAGLPASISTDALLKGFWNLDEYNGAAALVSRLDSSGNGNTLTDVGNTQSGQGVNYYEGTVGKWYDKTINAKTLIQLTQANKLLYRSNIQNGKPVITGDGLTKSIYNATDLIGTGDVTVFAVIKPRGWGGGNYGRIIDNGKFQLGTASTNSVMFVSSDNGGTSIYSANSSISLNTAYVVAVTRTSAGVANIYIKPAGGAFALSGAANQNSGVPAAGSSTFCGNNQAGTRGFDGDIDCITIYNRILTASELSRLAGYLGLKWGI